MSQSTSEGKERGNQGCKCCELTLSMHADAAPLHQSFDEEERSNVNIKDEFICNSSMLFRSS
ncbi:hypothetical protein M514_09545 [Trichuris suis]|uniref:Uncharacterized protein n=1 Tax=Trichuris suis TaxID=68888 RepID=A0A085NL19_9BILA|nr:hypothetical protein M513_09545 [Trichuris suis]KFD70165.1 hypothetical protein M514_09545 [Trichuris suis]